MVSWTAATLCRALLAAARPAPPHACLTVHTSHLCGMPRARSLAHNRIGWCGEGLLGGGAYTPAAVPAASATQDAAADVGATAASGSAAPSAAPPPPWVALHGAAAAAPLGARAADVLGTAAAAPAGATASQAHASAHLAHAPKQVKAPAAARPVHVHMQAAAPPSPLLCLDLSQNQLQGPPTLLSTLGRLTSLRLRRSLGHLPRPAAARAVEVLAATLPHLCRLDLSANGLPCCALAPLGQLRALQQLHLQVGGLGAAPTAGGARGHRRGDKWWVSGRAGGVSCCALAPLGQLQGMQHQSLEVARQLGSRCDSECGGR
eukprot:366084-Chlamydomonas_euryale.AAC.4